MSLLKELPPIAQQAACKILAFNSPGLNYCSKQDNKESFGRRVRQKLNATRLFVEPCTTPAIIDALWQQYREPHLCVGDSARTPTPAPLPKVSTAPTANVDVELLHRHYVLELLNNRSYYDQLKAAHGKTEGKWNIALASCLNHIRETNSYSKLSNLQYAWLEQEVLRKFDEDEDSPVRVLHDPTAEQVADAILSPDAVMAGFLGEFKGVRIHESNPMSVTDGTGNMLIDKVMIQRPRQIGKSILYNYLYGGGATMINFDYSDLEKKYFPDAEMEKWSQAVQRAFGAGALKYQGTVSGRWSSNMPNQDSIVRPMTATDYQEHFIPGFRASLDLIHPEAKAYSDLADALRYGYGASVGTASNAKYDSRVLTAAEIQSTISQIEKEYAMSQFPQPPSAGYATTSPLPHGIKPGVEGSNVVEANNPFQEVTFVYGRPITHYTEEGLFGVLGRIDGEIEYLKGSFKGKSEKRDVKVAALKEAKKNVLAFLEAL